VHGRTIGGTFGDPGPVAVVNEAQYIQHNPQTHEGSEGLAALFQRLSKTSPRVNIVRAFEDGDFVFAHTEYDFARRNIGFEVFRFEDGQAVEHWDNIQERHGPNQSGRIMVDGPTEAVDNGDIYAEHNPRLGDGVSNLRSALEVEDESGRRIDYHRVHRILAEGNFVLCVSEGSYGGDHTAFYDLFRLAKGELVEHWDTTEKIAPRSEWKNDNGKF